MFKHQLTTLLCGGALALSLSILPATARAAEPAPIAAVTDPLAETQWELTSPRYAGLQNKPTLQFEGARLSASVGLNRMGAGYSASDNALKIAPLASTRKAGPPALMKAETRYGKTLQSVRSFEISPDGQTLVLRGDELLTFGRTGDLKAENPLAFSEWELADPVYPGLDKKPTLTFADDNLSASVGLNAMGAAYAVGATDLKLEQFISTMMAGPPALMKAEDSFKKALEGTRTYKISDDGQTLLTRGDQPLTFDLKNRASKGSLQTETKIINVAPQLGPQMDGDQTPKYLQLEDLGAGPSWGRFTEEKIVGFDYQPGNRYQLRVAVDTDALTASRQLRLIEVFSQHYMATAQLGADDVILEVAPSKVDCFGVAPMKCLLVRENGGEWKNFYAPIGGFDFVEGSRYRLQVNVRKVANPPADASNLRYELVRVLDKMPVTY